ncbi:hypothetical protein WN48_01723 [Eufriesea mexicana]|nr:hypothetical protein WN48_01723 [Eufriesea mexicana]
MRGRLNGVSQGGKQENGAVGTRGPMSSQATIAAANTFPGTHVMILLYYANYAVPTHGQWCILMAMAAQRGAVTIDQSCFGYANSAQAGKREPLTGDEERGDGGARSIRKISTIQREEPDDVEKPATRVPFFGRGGVQQRRAASIVGQRKRERSSEIPRAREEIISRLEGSISRWRVGTPEAGAYIVDGERAEAVVAGRKGLAKEEIEEDTSNRSRVRPNPQTCCVSCSESDEETPDKRVKEEGRKRSGRE